jgi:hypothetical protein
MLHRTAGLMTELSMVTCGMVIITNGYLVDNKLIDQRQFNN